MIKLFTKRSQNLDDFYPERMYDIRQAMNVIYSDLLRAVKYELTEKETTLYLLHKVSIDIEWKSEVQGGFRYVWAEANAHVEEEDVR